jgi:hypothetical protein
MNVTITIDWRFVFALGGAAALVLFAKKMDSAAAEQVLTHTVSIVREYAIAAKSTH